MSEKPQSRRQVVKSLCALPFAGTFAAAGCSANGRISEQPESLDLNLPQDALTALIKMRGSLEAVDVPHWYYGTIYAVLPGKTPIPMVDFEGSEIDFYERQPDGSYFGYGATVSFMRDTRTGKLLETFANPITGKRNRVTPNSISVKAHYIYSTRGIKRSDDARPLPENGNIVNSLHWRQRQKDVWLTMRRAYPAGLPMAEHQLVRGARAELHDPDTPAVMTTAAPTFIAPWLGWMDMQDHPGHTVWAGPAKKLRSVTEYPRELLDLMEKHYPHKLTAKPG